MTTVQHLFNKMNFNETFAAVCESYPGEGKNKQGYVEAWDIIQDLTAAPTSTVCVLSARHSHGTAWVDVHGRLPGSDDNWAIEYEPWAEWLSMEIDVQTPLKEAQVLAQIFYEMTWAGYGESEVQEQKDEIIEAVRDLKKELGV